MQGPHGMGQTVSSKRVPSEGMRGRARLSLLRPDQQEWVLRGAGAPQACWGGAGSQCHLGTPLPGQASPSPACTELPKDAPGLSEGQSCRPTPSRCVWGTLQAQPRERETFEQSQACSFPLRPAWTRALSTMRRASIA